MQIELDWPTRAPGALEDHPPQLVAALADPALAVRADGQAGDVRTLLQEERQGVTAVRPQPLGREPFDPVVGVGAVRPLVRVGPQPELEVQAAARRLVADEAQHLQVGVTLAVGEVRRAHVVARDREQEGVGEVQVGVPDPRREVVAEPEGEIEAIEALGHEHREIGGPELPVAEPRLVLDVAAEKAHAAPNGVRGLAADLDAGQRRARIVREGHAIRKLGQRIHVAARVSGLDDDGVAAGDLAVADRERLLARGERRLARAREGIGDEHHDLSLRRVSHPAHESRPHTSGPQGLVEVFGGPAGGR